MPILIGLAATVVLLLAGAAVVLLLAGAAVVLLLAGAAVVVLEVSVPPPHATATMATANYQSEHECKKDWFTFHMVPLLNAFPPHCVARSPVSQATVRL